MKTFPLILFLAVVNFSALSQPIVDTCEYVSQNNTIGGLDCYMGSLAQFTADSYQWLNCDSLFAPFPGDTAQAYSGPTSTNVALVITYLGCVDTSQCNYACTWGLEELYSGEIELLKIVDLMGRETEDKPNTLLIYIYSDGTAEKVFRVE
jgi:hypothetical protein